MSHRQIVLDTETTGLEPALGHRIIEIGAVEIVNRRVTDRHFHVYLNPERDIDEGALAVHGLTLSFLKDKPLFSTIVQEFLEFIGGDELIIHNASFDLKFIHHELQRLKGAPSRIDVDRSVIDTLLLARQKHPGQRNNLDALCKRYSVDHSKRDLHGALLDARLLAYVYLAMTGGQSSLFDLMTQEKKLEPVNVTKPLVAMDVNQIPIIKASQQDLEAHEQHLKTLAKQNGVDCVWKES
jgi:DNA polymerase-3 subunit epsilon